MGGIFFGGDEREMQASGCEKGMAVVVCAVGEGIGRVSGRGTVVCLYTHLYVQTLEKQGKNMLQNRCACAVFARCGYRRMEGRSLW